MNASDATSPHAEIARRLLHDRSDASHPRVSPDGRHVAAVVSTTDLDENTTRSRVWLDGAPLTSGPYDSEPTWSPDGRALAFVRMADRTSPKRAIHIVPVTAPGESRQVAELPDGCDHLAWSPDGRWLAFTSRARDARYDLEVAAQPPRRIDRFFTRLNGEDWVFDRPSHVHVVAADGTGSVRDLTPGPHQHAGVSWLADSSGVVTSAARHETWDRDLCVDLHVVRLDGRIEALTHRTGSYRHPAVSPDGRHVAFVGNDDSLTYPQNARVGVITTEGTDRRWISIGLDRTFDANTCPDGPVWIDDRTLFVVAEDRGEQHVHAVHLDGAPPERITTGAISVVGFDARAGVLATTSSTVDRTAELYVDDRDGTRRTIELATPRLGWERLAVPCTDGTDEIDAWIMRPEGFDPDRRYPVLLNVHGGPFTQYGETFFDEAQMQAAAGFVVVMSNPRGGSGRHTAWGQSIMGPKHPTAPGTGWGSVDVDDVLAVLDHVLAHHPFCDPDRVGMLGGSYGGYMATMLAARHGDRFRAVCSERAVNNLLTEEWTSDIGSMFRIEHGPDPVEDPDEYLRMSPSLLARDIHVPVLIIHSEEDWRCPIGQAEELWMTLRLLDRDVTFYRFPGENHELSRSGSPVHRRMRGEIILDFFSARLAER